MFDYFYTVDLSGDEELARTANYVDKFLVELVCEDHRNENRDESARGKAAAEIAAGATKNRYGLVGTENVGYNRASRYDGKIPSNIGEARFTAPCGCRAWYL